MNLQPQRGDEKIAIPVTFDARASVFSFKKSRLIISALIMAVALIFWIVVLIIAEDSSVKWLFTGIAWVVVPLICRFGIVHEMQFRKNYIQLADADYTYDYKLFWNIYDTSDRGGVTFFHHTNGFVSVFIAFDKGVIVGKGDYADYDHYEAIAYAYNLLHKRGIRCTHIDYMDSVGKDVRLQHMYENVKACENPELQASVLDMIDYMQYQMEDTYADYDVYCFTAKMRPDLMWDELTSVLGAFLGGNYIRDRVLDRNGVRDVISTLLRLPDFSVTRTCDSLFGNRNNSKYLRVIWTETDGKREIVNKTRKQMAEEQKLQQQEREARKSVQRNRRGKEDERIVDVFAEVPAKVAPQQPKQSDMFSVFNAAPQTKSGGFGVPAAQPQGEQPASQTAPSGINLQKTTGQQGINMQKNAVAAVKSTSEDSSSDEDEVDLF